MLRLLLDARDHVLECPDEADLRGAIWHRLWTKKCAALTAPVSEKVIDDLVEWPARHGFKILVARYLEHTDVTTYAPDKVAAFDPAKAKATFEQVRKSTKSSPAWVLLRLLSSLRESSPLSGVIKFEEGHMAAPFPDVTEGLLQDEEGEWVEEEAEIELDISDDEIPEPSEYSDVEMSEPEPSTAPVKTESVPTEVEEKFMKFSGEPRDAREILCHTTYFWTNFEQN